MKLQIGVQMVKFKKNEKKKRRNFHPVVILGMICLGVCFVLLNGCSFGKMQETATQEGGVKVGDTISFGSYDKDGNQETEKEKLTWLVLAVEKNKALVITSEGVDCQQYHETATAIEWENSSLRSWLNKKFFSEAFTSEEAARIVTTEVPWEKNPSYSHTPGKTVQDKLFLLSISEAERYFSSEAQRTCKPTPLAIQHMVYEDESTGNCPWWLRNSGSVLECAAFVDEFGVVNYDGDGVYCEGSAVRPAMWIELS